MIQKRDTSGTLHPCIRLSLLSVFNVDPQTKL